MLHHTKYLRLSRRTARAITLVEMLIAMAVTLLMMAAVVNLFANIGSGVRNRRASMELGSQLRIARARLFKDLAGATCAVRPKLPSDDHDDGYFEIVEGQWSDKNPSGLVDGNNGNGELDRATTLVPGSNLVLNGSDGFGLGDYDDILALTVRSESEPFVGRMPVWDGANWLWQSIESELAEVIWYSVENPADGSLGEPGMRTVYRRVLLIAPWVNELPGYAGTPPPSQTPIDLDRIYYQLSDISFRREGNVRVANTLSDLTKGENRFAHDRGFPHAMDLVGIRNDPSTVRNNFPEFTGNERTVLHPFGLPFEWDEAGTFMLMDDNNSIPVEAPGEVGVGSDRSGEDVMLNDVLAFDLRVFDPGAPLYLHVATNLVLEPSDNGWPQAYLAQEQPNEANPVFDAFVGQGAYVDLGYVDANNLASIPPNNTGTVQPLRPLFSGLPNPLSRLGNVTNFLNQTTQIQFVTYDSGSFHYESDGINQDGDTFTDEGTDGLDNDDANGVDDALEREAPPPYDHPLRGMQAKIRVYDRESRQIREATVTKNFVPQ